jgi:hypothetical protein
MLLPRYPCLLLSLKRITFNLTHLQKAKRLKRLGVAPRFEKICVSGFSRNA